MIKFSIVFGVDRGSVEDDVMKAANGMEKAGLDVDLQFFPIPKGDNITYVVGITGKSKTTFDGDRKPVRVYDLDDGDVGELETMILEPDPEPEKKFVIPNEDFSASDSIEVIDKKAEEMVRDNVDEEFTLDLDDIDIKSAVEEDDVICLTEENIVKN